MKANRSTTVVHPFLLLLLTTSAAALLSARVPMTAPSSSSSSLTSLGSQLRMRSAPSSNTAASSTKQHKKQECNYPKQGQTSTQHHQHRLSLKNSRNSNNYRSPILLFSKLRNHYPWRGRGSSATATTAATTRSATLLQAHGKEKSAYLEDLSVGGDAAAAAAAAADDDATQQQLQQQKVQQQLDENYNYTEDAALLGMEQGAIMTSSPNEPPFNNDATTTTTATIPPPTLLFGIPLQSIILLNLVAIIWGTQHAVIKSVVDDETSIGLFGGGGEVVLANLVKSMEGWLGSTINLNNGNFDGGGGSSISSDGSNAAYFTMARFGLAALLASPYTPGLSSAIERVKGMFARGVTGGQQEEEDLVALVTIENNNAGGNEEWNSNSSMVSTTASTSSSTSLDNSNSNSNNSSHNTNSINLAWRYGFELGIYMFLGYAFQAIGLETTTASRSGFLLYLNVKLVPFFSFLIFGKSIRKSTWISALVAFGGTALLSLDNASSTAAAAATAGGVGSIDGDGAGLGMAFTVGDLWSIAAAAASAMFILRMEAASKAVPKSSELNAANLWTVAILSLFWTMGISWNNLKDVHVVDAGAESLFFASASSDAFIQTIRQTFHQTMNTIITHPIPLLYLSGVTTALANYLQSKAQKDVTAERASVIYAMDPVYGAIFANILLGEQLGGWGWVGAGFIVVAAATNAIWDFGSEAESEMLKSDIEMSKEKI